MLCAIAFAGRFAWLLVTGGRARAGPPITPRTRLARFDGPLRRVVPLLALAAVPRLSPLVLALAGPGGALKWIDNFGILILIFVMLGWGSTSSSWLAGLLDLGYVAFYAVGAYATALIATHFGFSYWMRLPLAGLFAALWGVMLGFPVLRLRGDYLAIVTLAFGEIIRLVLINWGEVTGGANGLSGVPRPTFFGIPFNATTRASPPCSASSSRRSTARSSCSTSSSGWRC